MNIQDKIYRYIKKPRNPLPSFLLSLCNLVSLATMIHACLKSFWWLSLLKTNISFAIRYCQLKFHLLSLSIKAAKICNNLAMAVSMLGVSEALALGQKLGIAASTLTKIFNSSSARCWSRYCIYIWIPSKTYFKLIALAFS